MESSLSIRLEQVLERAHAQRGRHLSILEALQQVEAAIGYVPPESISRVAESLGVTDAQVAGVLSDYPDLHSAPRGRHVIRLCQGEACLANHGSRVWSRVCEQLRATVGTTTPDGRYTIEKVYCVGNCAVSPTVMVDEDLYGRVTPDQIPALLERYK